MKHKGEIGRCSIANHPGEVEPGAVPHREGARRMSPEKAEPFIYKRKDPQINFLSLNYFWL